MNRRNPSSFFIDRKEKGEDPPLIACPTHTSFRHSLDMRFAFMCFGFHVVSFGLHMMRFCLYLVVFFVTVMCCSRYRNCSSYQACNHQQSSELLLAPTLKIIGLQPIGFPFVVLLVMAIVSPKRPKQPAPVVHYFQIILGGR